MITTLQEMTLTDATNRLRTETGLSLTEYANVVYDALPADSEIKEMGYEGAVDTLVQVVINANKSVNT